MKKLLIFMLVLGVASAANANMVWFDTAVTEVVPSTDITIVVKADFDVLTVQLAIGGPPTASQDTPPGGLHANMLLAALNSQGTVMNDGTILIREIFGGDPRGAAAIGVPAGEVIYSFLYHVPNEPPSTQITITSQGDWFVPPPEGPYEIKTALSDLAGGDIVTSLGPLVLHIIPEPMTIALLGLGGLFLRRRK